MVSCNVVSLSSNEDHFTNPGETVYWPSERGFFKSCICSQSRTPVTYCRTVFASASSTIRKSFASMPASISLNDGRSPTLTSFWFLPHGQSLPLNSDASCLYPVNIWILLPHRDPLTLRLGQCSSTRCFIFRYIDRWISQLWWTACNSCANLGDSASLCYCHCSTPRGAFSSVVCRLVPQSA
jgi:hypothetical protein